MDGHALGLDDDSFDVAGSQFGVMLFPDMPRMRARRVPRGRIAGQPSVTQQSDQGLPRQLW